MNIFVLSLEQGVCARWHNDAHVVKMCLESAQLLSTAHRVLAHKAPNGYFPGEYPNQPHCYKETHVNHPCSIWVRKSRSNYRWLYQLMLELDIERQHRFTPKPSKTIVLYGEFLSHPPDELPEGQLTPFAQAMPDECRRPDPIKAYQEYYRVHKQHLAKWTKRQPPSWFTT